jgi:hypothetical protein
VQYGFPGSGSTFVWQVLNSIFEGTRKTHVCPSYRPDCRIVATVRDFRDVLCTYFVRADLPVTRESIDFIVNRLAEAPFNELFKMHATWRRSENIVWLRYENFFDNFDYLFGQIEQFFKIELTAAQQDYCRRNFSLAANKARNKEAEFLCNRDGARGWLDKKWTQYTIDGINGLHITGNGNVGKWRSTIPADLHDHVNHVLAKPLRTFGYD